MALKPLNSVGGFSVGEIPANVILANADITANKGTFSGNLLISNVNANWGILTDNLYYSNGVPWDLQEAAGSNNEIQFNLNDDFAASANLTFDPATNTFTVLGNANLTTVNTTNVNSAGNLFLTANGFTLSLYANGLAEFEDGVYTTGNLTVGNANIGNGNIHLYANGEIEASTANFSGNVYASTFIGNVQANITITAANTQVLFSNGGLVDGSNNFTFDFASNALFANGTANITGNTSVGGILTDNYYYANGAPVDFQQPAGSNTQIQYNDDDDFGASANFTWDQSTNTLSVLGNANITTVNTSNVVGGGTDVTINANGYVSTFYGANGLVDLPAALTANGNLTVANAVLGNVAVANYLQVNANTTTSNLTVNLELAGNTANFSGNVILPNLTVNSELVGNTANFSGNVILPNITVNNELSGNTANFSGNVILPNLTVNLELAGNTANFSSNVVVNNLTTNLELAGNTANFSGNVVVPNLTVNLELAGNTANFTGNITSLNADLGNLAVANYVNVAQQVNGNIANFTGNLTAANAALGNLVTANYVNVANDLNVVGNVNAGNLVGILANGNSNVTVFANANIEFSSTGNANVVTITQTELLSVGNIRSTAANVVANGNVTANGFLNSANANVTGQAVIGSVRTANINSNGDIVLTAGANSSIELVPNGTGTVDVNGFRITQVADPVDPLDAANKEYVDALAGEGLVIHTPVLVEAESALNATYAQGGTTPTVTTIANNKDITFSAAHGLSVNDGIVFDNTFNGLTAGEAYWVYSVVDSTTITVKDGYFGPEVTTLTNGTSLTETSRANPGVGATLTNAGANAALEIDGISLSTSDRVLVYTQSNAYENGIYVVTTVGDGSTAWVLTRATDFNKYIPGSSLGIGKGSYTFVEEGDTGAGESYVMTLPIGQVIVGTTDITFTQFSAAGAYTAGNGIAINGTIISANVDNVTTALVGGNIVVKTSANLTTPNLGDATFSSLSWNTLSNGNVTANNLSIGNIANITLDLTVGGNIQANGTISANANVSGLNITTNGNVTAAGNVIANNVTGNTLLTVPTANVSNIVNAGNVTITNELSGNTANFSGNVIVPNLTVNLELAGNTANFSGNVIVPNLTVNLELAGNTANFSGNVIVPNLTVNLELAGNTANFTGNIAALNTNAGNLLTANFVTTGEIYNGNSNVVLTANGNISTSVAGNANVFVVTGTGANVTGTLDVSGNLSAGNVSSNNITANIYTANTAILLGNTAVKWGTVTTSAITANQVIAEAPFANVTGVEFLVKGEDSAGAKYSMATVQAVTDGANVDYATFATLSIGGSTGTLVVGISGSNFQLMVTPSSTNSTVWTTQYRTI